MGVTIQMLASAFDTNLARSTWADVIDEITLSCTARAQSGQLLTGRGVVGVLAGAAPVVWVHGATDVARLRDVLAASPEVDEIYVSGTQQAVVEALAGNGWDPVEVVAQTVHDGAVVPQVIRGLPAVHSLQPGDMADVRTLLRTAAGVDESLLEASYSDDFFTVAAPVWMYGARDGAGRLVGLIALRRQHRAAMGFALTVDESWRSTGLSTALVAAAVRQSTAVGATFLHAQAGERSVRRLTDCGFATVGTWHRMVRS
jgi:GNAT superfamily N-acetyltransferase